MTDQGADEDRLGGPWADTADFYRRYHGGQMLGEGGMGEVRTFRDARVGREVAMKVLRDRKIVGKVAAARFVREARVQGQLEHPAIVPVYDIGHTPDGAAYFTMKRVRGHTLADVIDALHAGDAVMASRYNRRKLLSAFTQVCLAVDFAHRAGVLHRDLKPANVMLGDFGEVYVLDWGLAHADDTWDPTQVAAAGRVRPGAPLGETSEGEVFGTAGYMPPEQVRGETARIGARSDVYALGAILFEILSYERLHAGTTNEELIASTLRGADARPSCRPSAVERDVPPDLDAACRKATSLEPRDRHDSARALSDEVERFLDGDRDRERRRELAVEHVAEAERAVERALSPSGTESDRAGAMRAAGKALALDPSDARASQVIVRVMASPPHPVPAAAERELLAGMEANVRRVGAIAAMAFGVWVTITPGIALLGVREPVSFFAAPVMGLVGAAVLFFGTRTLRTARAGIVAAMVCATIAMVAASRILGPLIIIPAVAFTHTILAALFPGRTHRAVVIGLGVTAMGLPVIFDVAGIWPSQMVMRQDALCILPGMLELRAPVPIWLAAVTGAFLLVLTVLLLGRVLDAHREAERRAGIQAWHLRHMVGNDPSAQISGGSS
jgi:eukaryotic-like serine/threonine-protein kinase